VIERLVAAHAAVEHGRVHFLAHRDHPLGDATAHAMAPDADALRVGLRQRPRLAAHLLHQPDQV
jgi:hypothetical protein